MKLDTKGLATIIDYSLLGPDTTRQDIEKFCDIEKEYQFGTVYVLPANFTIMRDMLDGLDVLLGTGIGFPFGTHETKTKLFECGRALEQGADVVDFVINVGALKSGNIALVENEVREMVALASPKPVKVILEVSYLTDEEIAKATRIVCGAGAAYVKTGTGFGPRGTTMNDAQLLLDNLSGETKVKVAGGIKDIETLLEMYRRGVSLFGLSKGPEIIRQFEEKYQGLYEC